MSIRFDATATTVLAVCTGHACTWRALRSSDLEATAAAVQHEATCHPASYTTRNAATKRAQRARQSSNVHPPSPSSSHGTSPIAGPA